MGRVQAGRCAADGSDAQADLRRAAGSRASRAPWVVGDRAAAQELTRHGRAIFMFCSASKQGRRHFTQFILKHPPRAPCSRDDMLFRGQVRLREPAPEATAAAMAAALHRLFHTRIRTDLVGPIGLRHLCCSWITRHAGSIDGP